MLLRIGVLICLPLLLTPPATAAERSAGEAARGFFDRVLRADKPEDVKAEAEAELDAALTEEASATAGCPQSGDPTKVGWKDKAAAWAKRRALQSAANDLELGDVELPAEVSNVCEAEKRLDYIDRSTARWTANVVEAVQQAAASLTLDSEIESYRMFADNPDFSTLSDSDIATLREDLDRDLKKIEQAMRDKTEANEALLTEASANLNAAMLHGTQLGAWDQRMIDFMSENIGWAWDHIDRTNLFLSHVKMLGGTMKGIREVSAARGANRQTGVDDDLYARTLAAREEENAAFEAEIQDELEL